MPTNHRPNDSACLTTPPAGNCQSSGAPGMCNSDSSCTAGTNGRCVEAGGDVIECACTYDTCADDSSCPSGQTCACHGSPYNDNDGNACVVGNCRVDADCGADGYCSPSEDPMSCGSLLGYYCHTAADLCLDDTDCPTSSMGGPQLCTYATANGRWECTAEGFCG